jgi:hypothetical protein
MEMSGKLQAPAALAPGRNTGITQLRGWVDFRVNLDILKKQKFCPYLDTNPIPLSV